MKVRVNRSLIINSKIALCLPALRRVERSRAEPGMMARWRIFLFFSANLISLSGSTCFIASAVCANVHGSRCSSKEEAVRSGGISRRS